jgi:glycosyltransferase involved in cell wall biosynthesis
MPTQTSSKKPYLSLIIPAYKQQRTIQRDLRKIKSIADKIPQTYEIIVVIDGKVDKTKEEAKKLRSPRIKVVGYTHNRGKGYAVRYGMAYATGSVIAFIDAGMDLDPESLLLLIEYLKKEKADIVIGSKLHPLSKVKYPWQRKVMSWGYRSIVRSLFGLSVRDTQVGCKLYKRKVLEDVLPRLLVKTFAFDIEMLAVAHRIGYTRIVEAPIELKYTQWSSITNKNFWKIIYYMLWDTMAVFYRLRIRHYYDDESKRKWKYDPELNFRINIG